MTPRSILTRSQYTRPTISPRPATASAVPALPYPVLLQRHAEGALRRQALRDLVRVGVLVAGDLGVLVLLRLALVALRDHGALGGRIERLADVLAPRGTLYPFEFAAAILIGLVVFRTYRCGDHRRDPRRVFLGVSLGVALVSWSRLWHDRSLLIGAGFFLAAVVAACAIALTRLAIEAVVGRIRPERRRSSRLLVVGPGTEARQALRELAEGDSSLVPIGYVDTDGTAAEDAVGGTADLLWALEGYHVDFVVLCGGVSTADARDVMQLAGAAGCQVFEVPRAFAPGYREPVIAWRRGVPLIMLTQPSMRTGQMALKRAFDVVAASVGLVVLSPLFAALALAIRVTTAGPAIFAQVRIGRGGRRFRIFKFRSMVVDAESRRSELVAQSIYADDRLFKVAADPRVTKLGAVLRRSSLDELPQLWNVLRGDMSLVGPRPPLLSELSRYEEHQYARFDMKPGITGPWQVGGRNNITSFEEVIRLETEYMREWSVWKDVGILLRTVPAVFRTDEAH